MSYFDTLPTDLLDHLMIYFPSNDLELFYLFSLHQNTDGKVLYKIATK